MRIREQSIIMCCRAYCYYSIMEKLKGCPVCWCLFDRFKIIKIIILTHIQLSNIKCQWFSGKIQRCQRWAPGSIPGWRTNKLFIYSMIYIFYFIHHSIPIKHYYFYIQSHLTVATDTANYHRQ